MRSTLGWTGILLVAAFAGCLQDGAPTTPMAEAPGPQRPLVAVPPEVRDWVPADVTWTTDRMYSLPLDVEGLDILPVEHVAFAASDGVMIDTAVWRPKVAEGVKVPVILDVGPYYGNSIQTLGSTTREGLFFGEGFVQNGFAYGRVAIRGTSTSGGCMEFFSLREQMDVDEAVTFFGTQPWSNGNVGLYGASYDGTTPWMAAAFGNPHLKTIVPVSGLTDVGGLMFRNGTNEVRGEIMHSVVYWPFGFESYRQTEDIVANAACPEAWWGAVAGPWTSNTGDRQGLGPTDGYWDVRDFRQRVLDNYEGSVYMVHGLQDWNVEPTMAYPYMESIEAKGLRTKHMLGQWGHDWPDRSVRENATNEVIQNSVRWDWAELLLRWFTQELKEEPVAHLGAPVDVQDNRGNWRTELTWPPRDVEWVPYHLGAGILMRDAETAPGEDVLYDPAQVRRTAPSTELPLVNAELSTVATYDALLGPLKEDLRFAGLVRVHTTFVPTSPEGTRMYAELIDVAPGGAQEIVAHGLMDLRYYRGGQERQDLVPGQPIQALMELFPADVVIPKGHTLMLHITAGNQRSGTQEHPAPTPVTIQWGDGKSILYLPEIVRDVGDGRYIGQPDPPEVEPTTDGGGGLPFHPYQG